MRRDDFRGHPGLRRSALDALLKAQPKTVLEALQLPDVGRKTTARLLALGLVTDPEGVQRRTASDAPNVHLPKSAP
jgi:hypothetical protein